jgi:predicted phosphodiesterase
MKIAILSDIHANLYALEAVLDASANKLDAEYFWSLGDVVGYGPHPVNTLLFLKRYVDPDAWVMGNHDAMLADLVLPEDVSQIPAGNPLIHTRVNKGLGREITARNVFMKEADWLKTTSMPVEVLLLNREAIKKNPEADLYWHEEFQPERATARNIQRDGMNFVLVHGSHADPLSRYIYGWEKDVLIPRELKELKRTRGHAKNPIIQFYGHTHVPTFIHARDVEAGFEIVAEKIFPEQTFDLDGSNYFLINPGSVGQPRDRDQRASFVMLDTGQHTVTFHRVEYDYTKTAHDLLAGGYPDSLVRRLQTASAAERETPDEWLQHYDEASQR